ncbi:MAG: cell division protein ZipA [Neisseriaceae bacterium]|nr:cell division protein ZipA [Neisseriaceae bacterium]
MILLTLAAAVILLVLAFNAYQETQYRKKIRKQFGHSDRDALLEENAVQVRDGETGTLNSFAPVEDDEEFEVPIKETKKASKQADLDDAFELAAEDAPATVPTETPADENKSENKGKLLIKLEDLKNTELSWFHPSFDYMAYISLYEPKELTTMPSLSAGLHRFRIVGCTMDGQFQPADPIPGVHYQAFVIGLQAISRAGLAERNELDKFGDKVKDFAKKMNGEIELANISNFLQNAQPLDELCARVDQIIAIHLVGHGTVTGTRMRTALQSRGFELSHDGAFYYPNSDEALFSAVDLEGRSFTSEQLSTQEYRGFSILFDVAHVPPGRKNFDKFMDLTVRLAGDLGLNLVDDQLQELSPQWLRDVGEYIAERQEEMLAAGLTPGDELANRLFS